MYSYKFQVSFSSQKRAALIPLAHVAVNEHFQRLPAVETGNDCARQIGFQIVVRDANRRADVPRAREDKPLRVERLGSFGHLGEGTARVAQVETADGVFTTTKKDI